MTGHSVHHVSVCTLSSFPTLFTSVSRSTDLQIFKTHSNLGFGTSLLLHLILLGFPMLILWAVELIEKTLLVHVIFLVLLLSVGLVGNKPLLRNPPQRPSM
jgi:hypothetical protein